MTDFFFCQFQLWRLNVNFVKFDPEVNFLSFFVKFDPGCQKRQKRQVFLSLTFPVLRAAGGSDRDVLFLGRWKSVPTSLTYSGSSAANNNRLLQLLSNPNLFTSSDIMLGRVLPPNDRSGWSSNDHLECRKLF